MKLADFEMAANLHGRLQRLGSQIETPRIILPGGEIDGTLCSPTCVEAVRATVVADLKDRRAATIKLLAELGVVIEETVPQ